MTKASHDIVTEMMRQIQPFAERSQLNVVIYRNRGDDELQLEAHIYRTNKSIEIIMTHSLSKLAPFTIFTSDGLKAYLTGAVTNTVDDDMLYVTYQGVKDVPPVGKAMQMGLV